MNTETMLFKIDIFLPSVLGLDQGFQACVGIHKLHLRILQPDIWNFCGR
jgi:hypothetical protein